MMTLIMISIKYYNKEAQGGLTMAFLVGQPSWVPRLQRIGQECRLLPVWKALLPITRIPGLMQKMKREHGERLSYLNSSVWN